VELHGGSVTARSDGPGQGSEFTVRLPASEPQPPPSPVLPDGSTSGEKPSVLIVDDNRQLAVSLARLLKSLGHAVETAHDGPEGIETARSCRPAVILLDIGLPSLDGYEVARRLRQEENLRETLIIGISGYGQDEDRRRSREAGMDHHLTKPVDLRTITELIGRPG
jgi:CheY-like chemotaxis protein